MSDPNETADETEDREGKKHHLGGDLIMPVATAAFAIYYLASIWGLSWQAASVGVGLSSGIAILLVILAVRFIGQYRRGEADLGLGELLHPMSYMIQRVAVLIAAIGFIYIMPYLGFTISLFIFLMVGIVILSGFRHIRTGLILATTVSLGGYLLFIVFIRARFPHGPFENFAGSLF